MILKRIAYSLVAFLAFISFLWLDFYLPQRELALIVGTEVKRVDSDGLVTSRNPADGQVRDVYYISTNRNWDDPTGPIKERVFRNEDTGLWFPFYFKFNSADVQARAKAFEQNKELVVITSYGWRLNMFSMFPNIVTINQATPETSTYSIRRYIGVGLWAAFFVTVTVWMRRRFNKNT
ncbi:DUF1523 family protein [Thorsellia anophelis]|uniref:DUF1523 domain-containing protein n=1 Tax=Thorsellia anophelis DSM 18579 TaxID=1123402 RepID=A0A1I0AG57_9GAMM|nr:DUF1523 family protein [Thorsellia anophelis]SES93237.1 Protein of unknown function [Thorsellia anophelis DSM 18579]